MKSVFNACYLAIFIQFARKIVDKVNVSLDSGVSVSHKDDSGNWYIYANNRPVIWQGDRDEAMAFCLNAIASCRSLAHNKFRIEENSDDLDLVSVDVIPDLTQDEILAINECIENME